MKILSDQISLTASDLVGHLSCRHLTQLDVQVAKGQRDKPEHWDPLLEILRERGFRHEQEFVRRLQEQGLTVAIVEGAGIDDTSVEETVRQMRSGVDIIIQGALRYGRWTGRADVLRKIQSPSLLGEWSYEVTDTKLARETKGTTVLQLCLYSDLLSQTQGREPENAYVVTPGTDFVPEVYRIADFSSFFRKVRLAAENATLGAPTATYPEPNPHCDNCRWYNDCERRLREDDSLTFVAGISKNQMTELRERDISRLGDLAAMPTPIEWTPKRGAAQTYEKIALQANIQMRGREAGSPFHELLPIEKDFGLCLLPEPNPGDVFLDLEGDPFAGENGLEYLFGYVFLADDGMPRYGSHWALNREEEKSAFESFVDFITERQRAYPGLRIYHYAPYEPAALKRLMGRYATRETEIDDLLRRKRFVDLYSVVRQALRASVESYSIKRMEPFYGFARAVPLVEANRALAVVQAGLELGNPVSVQDPAGQAVEAYNRDDCLSTFALRGWLEELRSGALADGADIPRWNPAIDAPSEELSERMQRVAALTARLTAGLPNGRSERSPEQQALWLLGNILDWHRREDKASYWEKFRLEALGAEDLLVERAGISGLRFAENVATDGKLPVHRYHFPAQDTDIRPGKKLRMVGGETFGEVADISGQSRTIDIKKMKKTIDVHPEAIYEHEIVRSPEQADCLLRIGEHVAEHGITGAGPYFAARSLLLRTPPNTRGNLLRREGETTLDAAIRVAQQLEAGVLPIQGPPGTGKSHTGARMICQFVAQGLRVGITGTSHKVIRNLIDKVLEAAVELDIDLRCIQKAKEKEDDQDRLIFAKSNEDLIESVRSGTMQVAGATAFLWARADAFEAVDVLVVDEAAQMSLANALAVSHAAPRLILLGDPQQLDEPTQGTHPDGTGVSSLDHVLGGQQTISDSQGLFLDETWRMHPDICAFDSELFYESKLHSVQGCGGQTVNASQPWAGSGLRYLSVPHTGNKSSSVEEAAAVSQLIRWILKSNATWINRKGEVQPVELKDILVITPYNAQVFEIQQRFPGARVGTVDKFQGQEAPIAIYSMATSSYADAPRGMEFLYSSNRFNVAISRAQCLAILVASPDVFEAECKTPRQMQLANAFCRFLELAKPIQL